MEQFLLDLIPSLQALWRSPECRRVVGIVAWLSAVSAGFWLLARVMGAMVEIFSELFFEELWAALATVYNIALAVFFSAVLFAAASQNATAGELHLRRAVGFVVVYLVLSATYTDPREGSIDEHARYGWAMGLVSYVFFAAVPSLTERPLLFELIAVMKQVADSWVGRASALLVGTAFAYRLSRSGLRAMFARLSPFLWFVGALKHPPIRVRR